jgi:hypothetical protein
MVKPYHGFPESPAAKAARHVVLYVQVAYKALPYGGPAVAVGLEALNWGYYGIVMSALKKKEANKEGLDLLADFPETYRNSFAMERAVNL